MQFQYQAKDTAGAVRSGIVVAQTQRRAEDLLRENNLVILSLEVLKEDIWKQIWPFGSRVPAKELVLFSRQLSTLISAQVSILQSLRILLDQIHNAYLKKIITETIQNIESGDSLSLSLSRHSEVFGNVYISVVHSGELSGSLDKSLGYLADQLEKDYDLNSKVRGALTYPAFILAALIVIGSLMFIFVLPNLITILNEQGGTLPPVTVALIWFTGFFSNFWWLLLLIVIGLFFGIRFALTTTDGRRIFDRAKLSTPIIGKIFEKIYLARFSRNLATLIMGGIPIIKALEVVSELVNNVIYRDIILEAADKLVSGKNISDAFAGYKEIPQIVTQMIQVGEKSATLTGILQKLAGYYEKEVDSTVGNLTTLIEPIIILVLGAAVGILVAGILLPIYNLASAS